MKRAIEEILNFRTDISQFLVHLTRIYNGETAKENLKKIINDSELECGAKMVSDAQWAMNDTDRNAKSEYFKAVCFSETPLNEIHCLLEIEGRNVDLEPYGLVFVKEHLAKKGVSPVLYINNIEGDKKSTVSKLCSLISSDSDEIKKLLPLVATFGKAVLQRK